MKNHLVVGLVWFIAAVILWEIGAWALVHLFHDPMATSKLPYLHNVILNLVEHGNLFLQESMVTLLNYYLGFMIGAIVGVVLAIWMSLSKTFEEITFPYLIFLQMIPVLGLAPIVYGIVRDEYVSRVLISAYITFFPVAIGLVSGIKSVEKEKRELMYSYAVSKWTLYTKLLLPASLPNLFNSLKATAPLAVTAAILVELMGAQRGIGVLILRNLYYGAPQAHAFWTSVFVSALLGIASYLIIVALEWLFVPQKR